MTHVRAIYCDLNFCFVCTLGEEFKSLRILYAWFSEFLPPNPPFLERAALSPSTGHFCCQAGAEGACGQPRCLGLVALGLRAEEA